ncbi:MAG: hypothetical protein H7145_05065 [Akkermansiaceae bacterium]|nr:hypothetical protein [Armatimonadota bacterium]
MQIQFTEQSRRAIHFAQIKAAESGSHAVEPEHLLFAILRDDHSPAHAELRAQECNPRAVNEELSALIISQTPNGRPAKADTPEPIGLSQSASEILHAAAEVATRQRRHFVGPEHVLMALILKPTPLLAPIWSKYNVSSDLSSTDQTLQRQQANEHERDHIATTPIDMAPTFENFTAAAKQAIIFAQQETARSGSNKVTPLFLLSGVLQDEETVVSDVLERCGVERNVLREALIDLLPTGRDFAAKDIMLDSKAAAAMRKAMEMSMTLGDSHIGTEHIFLGLINDPAEGGKLLRANNVDKAAFIDALRTTKRAERIMEASKQDPLVRKAMWLVLVAAILGWLWLSRQ